MSMGLQHTDSGEAHPEIRCFYNTPQPPYILPFDEEELYGNSPQMEEDEEERITELMASIAGQNLSSPPTTGVSLRFSFPPRGTL